MQELYKQYKGLLFTLAYQLTGSALDAEDVVQDIFLKINDVDQERLVKPKAYLCKMVTNRCRDLLKSAQYRREHYVGEWLPEPIATGNNDYTFESVVRNEQLSYAVLVLLEKLTPTERAVLVLHEAIGFKYTEIARIVGKSEANCRKLNSRAREKIGITTKINNQFEKESEQWIHQFLDAMAQDNVDKIVSILAEDVELISDGGGKVVSALKPIKSRENVAHFIVGLNRKASLSEEKLTIEKTIINGQLGLIIRTKQGIDSVVLLHIKDHTIGNIFFIRNPDKLAYLSESESNNLSL